MTSTGSLHIHETTVTLNVVIKRQVTVTELLQETKCVVIGKVFKLHQRPLSITTPPQHNNNCNNVQYTLRQLIHFHNCCNATSKILEEFFQDRRSCYPINIALIYKSDFKWLHKFGVVVECWTCDQKKWVRVSAGHYGVKTLVKFLTPMCLCHQAV